MCRNSVSTGLRCGGCEIVTLVAMEFYALHDFEDCLGLRLYDMCVKSEIGFFRKDCFESSQRKRGKMRMRPRRQAVKDVRLRISVCYFCLFALLQMLVVLLI